MSNQYNKSWRELSAGWSQESAIYRNIVVVHVHNVRRRVIPKCYNEWLPLGRREPRLTI